MKGYHFWYPFFMSMKFNLHLFFLLVFASFSFGQVQSWNFQANPIQKYGFDECKQTEWQQHYQKIDSKKWSNLFVPVKSVAYKKTDLLDFKYISTKNNDSLKFKIGGKELSFYKINDSIFTIKLPEKSSSYSLRAYFGIHYLGKIQVKVFKEIVKKIVVVPISKTDFQEYEIERELNLIFRQANLKFEIEFDKSFSSKVINSKTIFAVNPLRKDRFSGQMRLLRNLYFEANPNASKDAHYVFLVNDFTDKNSNYFCLPSKSISFVKSSNDIKDFTLILGKNLASGIGLLQNSWENKGPKKGSTDNFMDSTYERHLTHFQWEGLRHQTNIFSLYDSDENLKTNNGLAAYYFWKENKDGTIDLNSSPILNAINRPFRKNFLSYRFDVKFAIFRPFYKWNSYYISSINVVLIVIILIAFRFARLKTLKNWRKNEKTSRFWKVCVYISLSGAVVYAIYTSFQFSNLILDKLKIVSGPLPELQGLDFKNGKKELLENSNLVHQEAKRTCSEILIQKGEDWEVKKRQRVLYFVADLDSIGKLKTFRFVQNSDSLILSTLMYREKSQNHAFVISYFSSSKKLIHQAVFDFNGKEITSQLKEDKKAKRILLFVNGYRPTSIGHTFEDNFNDLKQKGLEFQNSKNVIYNFDRYDYWRQWNEINLLFQNRLNAHETYYADGHFSVETSNYRSLLNFTTISSAYPKRCANNNKHTCYYSKNHSVKKLFLAKSKTINKLKMSANVNGFLHRKNKGKIAAYNLLQVLNQIPGASLDDTLFVVAHSMGFAYAQGMLEVLRGKIIFGGYYIIAPENGKTGKVKKEEWRQVWQYGSNFNENNADAPCLQDGVAPQSSVKGIDYQERIFIPKDHFKRKGFFDSHFIGYYTWVLDIPKDQKGYVNQH
jgi:hypothetical protein